jgi:hypothetical protein
MTKVKSFRLTKTHRDTILSTVMAEWDKQNDKPEQFGKAEIVKELILQEKKKTKPKILRPGTWFYKMNQLANVQTLFSTGKLDTGLLITDELNVTLGIVGENKRRYPEIISLSANEADRLDIPYQQAVETHTYSNGLYVLGHTTPDPTFTDRHHYIEARTVLKGSMYDFVIKKTDPLYKKMMTQQANRNAHDTERALVKDEIRDYLLQFNSSAQLMEGWSELTNFLPAHMVSPETVINLPSTRISTLSTRMGLKKTMAAKRKTF